MLSEARVAVYLRKYFLENNWEILAFDFPQSGTGTVIKPNFSNEKNKESIIPDLVAKKNNMGVLIENKDRFYKPDFMKINTLRTNNPYSIGLAELFGGEIPNIMWYGIGIPNLNNHVTKAIKYKHMIDLLMAVSINGEVSIEYSIPFFE